MQYGVVKYDDLQRSFVIFMFVMLHALLSCSGKCLFITLCTYL